MIRSKASDQQPSRRNLLSSAGLGLGALAGASLLSACSTVTTTGGSAAAAGGAGSAGINNPAYDSAIKSLVNGRTVQLGWTPPILSEMFNQMEKAAFGRMAELEQTYGINWKWERSAPTGNFDAVEQQVSIVRGWTARKFDAVLVCTGANFATMQDVYRQASSSGTRVFQFNQPVELYDEEKINTVSNIGYDNRWQSGYLAGTFIAKTLGGKGKIIQIMGPSGSDWSKARQIGFEKALRENPGLEVVGSADGGYLRDKGLNAAQDLLTRNRDIDAIYGENEDMALGASQAVDAAGLKQWDGQQGVVIVGADGLLSGMESIAAGKLTATVDVGSVDQGRSFIDAVFRSVVLGETVAKVIEVPTRVVTKENVAAAKAYIEGAMRPPKSY
ncbi:sugar ABC transporter substrate-binding protein [Arthrobacter sp. CC3]|uniref:sugar ABC transporter substrate-binding protein n=1 Tax=Arthrobacter sp. CC3 TaxID=3029185 RepID=UPI003266F193